MENKNIIVGIDVDGIIRNWMYSFNYYYNFECKKRGLPLIDINYEPKEYILQECKGYNTDIIEKVRRFQTFNLCYYAPTYKESNIFMENLYDLSSKKSSLIRYITHQKTAEAKQGTALWLFEHGFLEYGSLIMCDANDKWKYCDILVDDKVETISTSIENGIIGICFRRNWNEIDLDKLKDYKYITNSYPAVLNFIIEIFSI